MKNSFGLNRYYIAVIVLCALAGFSARFLVMSPETTALMYMEAGLFDEAIKRYEKLLADGDKSGNVIIPLARLYRARGDEKLAQGLLIKYICENPDLKDARAVLDQMLRKQMSREDFRKILDLAVNFPDMNEILRDLSDWYEAARQDERQMEYLTELAKRPERKSFDAEYAKILGYFALNIKLAPVPAIRVKQILVPPDRLTKKQAFLRSFCVAVNSGRFQAAARQAAAHFENAKKLDAQEFESVVDILLSVGQPEMAEELCVRFLKGKDFRELLRLSRYRAEIARGGGRDVLSYMTVYFKNGSLKSKQSFDLLLSLAIKYKDKALISQLFEKLSEKGLPEHDLFNYLFYALENKDEALGARLGGKLSPDMLLKNPCLAHVLKAARRGIGVAACARQALEDKELSEVDLEELAYLFFHYDHPKEAYALLGKADPKTLLALFKMSELAEIAVGVPDARGLIYRIAKSSANASDLNRALIEDCALLLASDTGERKLPEERYADGKGLTQELLTDLYCHAIAYGEYASALEAAKTLNAKNASNASSFVLASALFYAGRYADAAFMAAPLANKIKTGAGLFLRACAAEAAENGMTALPQSLKKLADEELANILGNPRAIAYERIGAARYMAETGENGRAEAQRLCIETFSGFEPSAEDIASLISICDKRPGPEAREWLLKNLAEARWDVWQRLEWLNQAGMERDSVDYVEKTARRLEPGFLPEYLMALAGTGQAAKIDGVLERFKLKDFLKSPPRQKVKLLGLLPKTKFAAWSKPLLASMTRKEMLKSLDAADIAKMFIDSKLLPEGLALFGKTDGTVGKEFMAGLYLHAFHGERGIVGPWIAKAGLRELSELEAVYYFASLGGQVETAFDAAKRVLSLKDNLSNRLRVASAYLDMKDYENAIKLSEGEAESDFRAASIYLAAISSILVEGKRKKENAPLVEKALRICSALAERKDAPLQLRLNAAYALSNMGENARAKRIFRALAENAPSLAQGTLRMYLYCVFMEPEIQDYKTVSELVLKTPRSEEQEVLSLLDRYAMYGQMLELIDARHPDKIPDPLYPDYLKCLLKCRKMKAFEAAVAKLPSPFAFTEKERGDIFESLVLGKLYAPAGNFLESLPAKAKKKLSPNLVRELGLHLADKREFKKAIPIFFALAQDYPDPDSADVGTVAELVHEDAPRNIVDWFARQARKAKGDAQTRWLEYLLYMKQAKLVAKLMEELKLDE